MRKNAKECFAEMGKNGKMQNGMRSQMMQLDSPKLQKSIEKFRYGKRKTTFHEVTEYNGLEGTFHGGNPLLPLHAIGSHLEPGGDPNSPIPALLLQTFCSCTNRLTYWGRIPLQPWICSSWEPSQSHKF